MSAVAVGFDAFFCRQCHKIYSCPLSIALILIFCYFQKYKEFEKSVRVEEIDGVKLVKNLAVKMEEMFRKKAEATRVRAFYCFYLFLFMVIGKQ